ncbi:MAG TPA: choice-of-anchor L domain-containing protein [Ferruginibacter sp.]|nr:choice-of-anchor L domain-containing protein [Ferruginibacter sp.]HRE63442.1 choice-of-anchor L domain-containing protein [Ferruginibacter sp.]
MQNFTRAFLVFTFCFFSIFTRAQLTITDATSALALAQRLVGEGVTISNVSFTGNLQMAGNFSARTNVGIGLDSGIVITNGRARTIGSNWGVNGNSNNLADESLGLNGDQNLASAIGFPLNQLYDAAILEFDFLPLGDSIRFRYLFSSEEYTPLYACPSGGGFNDAFAFFISGPGFTGMQNIALVPNTALPVSIFNINNVKENGIPLCPNNPAYYIDNTGPHFTHDGHTTVLVAEARVQPCQTYHLKLVISDVGDENFDSGVFLEAKSLTSNATQLINLTQTDPVSGNSYLVEGCATGSLNIKRQSPGLSPLVINLSYGGTVVNGVDVQPLPASVIIPANQDSVLLNIFPIMDLLPEGIETLKIYTLAGCAQGLPTDSTEIQIRDYDILGITPDTAFICRNSSVQLQANAGYTNYSWDAHPALSSISIANPTVTLSSGAGMFVCTGNVGTCIAKDSAFVKVKDLELISKTDVNCNGGNTGQINIGAGYEWPGPVEFSIDGGTTYQTDSTFNNLPVGNYTIRIRDAVGCIDSISVNIVQTYPDLLQTNITTAASCTGNADGSIIVTASGGNPAYQYSLNGAAFVNNNTFNVMQGTHTVVIKDANGCTISSGNINVALNNTLQVDAGADEIICEGSSIALSAVATLSSTYSWTPAVALSSTTSASTTASPIVTTKYYITATSGICAKTDSVTVNVNAAPLANAGPDVTICFGADAVLQGQPGFTEYSWSPAAILNNSTLAQPTVRRPTQNMPFYLDVKDANGCTSLKKDTVYLTVTPAVQLFAGNDSVIVAIGQPVQLNALQIGQQTVTSWNWVPTIGLNNPNIHNPIATLQNDQTYIVTGKTPANCEGSDTIFIKVYKGPEIYVPSAFTPNGDGKNDVLRAIAIGMKEYRYFRVFNRYGQTVFETKGDFRRGWDGRVKGVLQNTGTYIWIAEAVDYRGNLVQRKGTTIIVQ